MHIRKAWNISPFHLCGERSVRPLYMFHCRLKSSNSNSVNRVCFSTQWFHHGTTSLFHFSHARIHLNLHPAMAIEIQNKKALFRYFLLEEYSAGIVLSGSEIKSLRASKANIGDAYCKMRNGELFVINMYIGPYSNAGYSQHKERNERKLLLNRIELRKIDRKLKDAGITIVPTLLFISEKGYAKLKIALAKGKNIGDKRADVKEKDLRRERERGQQ